MTGACNVDWEPVKYKLKTLSDGHLATDIWPCFFYNICILVINSLIRPVLAASHKFWYICGVLLSFKSKYFSNFHSELFIDHKLFYNMFFSFKQMGVF